MDQEEEDEQRFLNSVASQEHEHTVDALMIHQWLRCLMRKAPTIKIL
jgi:hypothetical protein